SGGGRGCAGRDDQGDKNDPQEESHFLPPLVVGDASVALCRGAGDLRNGGARVRNLIVNAVRTLQSAANPFLLARNRRRGGNPRGGSRRCHPLVRAVGVVIDSGDDDGTISGTDDA